MFLVFDTDLYKTPTIELLSVIVVVAPRVTKLRREKQRAAALSAVQYQGAGAAARAPVAHEAAARHAGVRPAVHRGALPRPHRRDGQLRQPAHRARVRQEE